MFMYRANISFMCTTSYKLSSILLAVLQINITTRRMTMETFFLHVSGYRYQYSFVFSQIQVIT